MIGHGHNGRAMTSTPPDPSPRRPLRWWAAVRSWPRGARLASYAVVALVLVLLAGLVTVVTLARRPLPQEDGEVALPGLAGDVEVVRDEHGVPQLYGDSVDDLVRAQGYVHASERFFEMDVRRHATAGRLAEMFGEDAVESDSYVRTMGWRRVAEQELALVRPDTRALLQAYAEGVNSYLAEHSPSDLAVEYTLLDLGGLDYRPEDWTPVDSLAWLKAMAWDLRGNMQDEIDRVLVQAAVGERRMRELYPAYDAGEHDPIVGQGAVVDGVFEQDATRPGTRNPKRPPFTADQRAVLGGLRDGLDGLPAYLGRGDGIGSNSWVVDGERSATGSPLLANDPHLGVGLPGVWMQVGLHCRTVSAECPLDVAGFSFSGVPGVVIGHNADIAWGFTNLGPDVTDLYLEKVRDDEWRYDGSWRPLRTRTETIEVADGDDVTLTVRSTRHGPILSDVADELADVGEQARSERSFAVSLAWTALEPAPTADAILDLNLADDWDSFRAALSSFDVPSQNVVYADRAGHVGYQAPGRIPIRKSGNDGSMPSAGWRPENDWTGDHVPYDGLPSVLDPDEGLVVAANQAVIGRDYPELLTTDSDWDHGWRSQRIRDVLEESGPLTVAAMQELQLDDRHPLAATLTPYLLDVDLPGGYWSGGQELLRDWDLRQSADSGAAAYYNVVWRTLLAATFHDELPEDQWPDGGQRWYAVVEELLARPDDAWWDDVTTDDVVETRDDVLDAAMREARDEMTRLQSRDPGRWSWGHLHRLDLRSPTLGESGIAAVERLVNRGGWQVGGGSGTVDAAAWDAAEGYGVTSAPSMRMVVDLGDLDASRWINLTGVSGHPASDHYTDQTDLWARGDYLVWPFSRDAVDAVAEHTLTLTPAETDE